MQWRSMSFPKLISLTVSITAIFLHSCIKAPSNMGLSRLTANSTSAPSITSVTYPNSLPFISSNNQSFTHRFDLNINSTMFQLKGDFINKFITNIKTPQCLKVIFPNTLPSAQTLYLKLYPQQKYNFTNQTIEYYYSLSPLNSTSNAAACPSGGIYTLNNICSTCSLNQLLSSPISFVPQSGVSLPDLSNLTIQITQSSTPQASQTCSNTSCKAQGSDCCINNTCVLDQSIQSSVNTSSAAFKSAESDITSFPSHIFNYPNFYNICPTNTSTPPAATTPAVDHTSEIRMQQLKFLYDCLNPSDGEMSICSKTYKNQIADTVNGLDLTTNVDDLNFASNTPPLPSSITEVYMSNILVTSSITKSGQNNVLTSAESINIKASFPANAFNTNITLRYKVNGSCKEINSVTAQCEKIYIQGQSTTHPAVSVMDHAISQVFDLPSYMDTSKTPIIYLDDILQIQGATNDWTIAANQVTFIKTVQVTQKVRIVYYVDLTTHPSLMISKNAALLDVQQKCNCSGNDCNLSPVLTNNIITDYNCKYPTPAAQIPATQRVTLSSKSIPLKFYDINGVYKKTLPTNSTQEGTAFTYTNNDLLTPNNIATPATYIGWHEVYGTMDINNLASPKPPLEVPVVKGLSYDIFVDTGNLSSCPTCGTDYYSTMANLFPANFLHKGGGYSPLDEIKQNPFQVSKLRADDLNFGRACFIPLSMIPWTHTANTSTQLQRLSRLDRQHFLFANGYKSDWFGFDYGSVIGSFDGIKWFSIGNQRRITASSSKMFIAINSYFTDLTPETFFTLTIQNSIFNQNAIIPSDNISSDGAECQKYYTCNTDRDCAAKVGWDYSCEDISQINTPWPITDSNGFETANSSVPHSLLTLFNATGGNKRCIYRGRGAICSIDPNAVTTISSYNGTANSGSHYCSANNYCAASSSSVFNQAISRYGKSVTVLNATKTQTNSTFGKYIKSLGRPLDYPATKALPASIQVSDFTALNVNAFCVPSKDTTTTDLLLANSSSTTVNADAARGIGVTKQVATFDININSFCPTFDSFGNNIIKTSTAFQATRSNFQNISTQFLDLLDTIATKTTSSAFTTQVTSPILAKNTCLRSPGSTCHTDFDCGPSKFISDQYSQINPIGQASLNEFEIRFWQEPMACSQATRRSDPTYSAANNKCCRESNFTLTIHSTTTTNPDYSILNPASALDINSPLRYSRMISISDLTTSTPLTYPLLEVAETNPATASTTDTNNQFNTFQKLASRVCCSGNWVRNFSTTNGGGHDWIPSKLQSIDPRLTFKYLNWKDPANMTCSDPTSNTCGFIQATQGDSDLVFSWLQLFDLIGVPQIMIEAPTTVASTTTPTYLVSKSTQVGANINAFTDNFIANPPPTIEYTVAGLNYLKASDLTNFTASIKPIFSSDEISCCLPVGSQTSPSDPMSACCSGFKNAANVCKLKDYTDVSLFFNSYISSATKDVARNLINPRTGFLNSMSDVANLACALNVCDSGILASGVALSTLTISGDIRSTKTPYLKYLDGASTQDETSTRTFYDAGLKLNNHYYCVPAGTINNDPLFKMIDCNTRP